MPEATTIAAPGIVDEVNSTTQQTDGSRAALSLWAAWAWFTAAEVALFPLVGLYASAEHGAMGWRAAGVAVGCCWVSGLLALVLAAIARGPNAVVGILGAMMVRTGFPFLVGMSIDSRGGPLADAGVFQLIVVVYLVTLIVETLLMLRVSGAAPLIGVAAMQSNATSGQAAAGQVNGSTQAPIT